VGAVALSDIAGEVIRPGDEGYEKAASTYAVQGAPAVVVRPRDAAEVASAIRYAVDEDLVLSVRSGAHSALGFGTNTGGVVIDLASLNAIEMIDPDAGLVRVGAGATWGAVADALQPHGLALSSGDSRGVGVGGLTLGGGVGWLVRTHGLTIDSLREAEVVTADGRTLRASADENPDLFWALRGGGGNFGVVTRLDFLAQQLATVYSGTVQLAFDQVGDVLRHWRDVMRRAPDELNSTLVLMPRIGEMEPAINVAVLYAGDEGSGAKAVEPLLGIGTVVGQELGQRPYAAMLEDVHPPEGVRFVVANTLVQEFGDALIAAIDAAYGGGESGVLFVRSLGRAMSEVPSDATAFAHRQVEALVVSGTMLPGDATDDDVAAALSPWLTLAAHGQGAYANFSGTATEEDLAQIYPPTTHKRLAEIKRDYDPGNLFSQNFNVTPRG
jgi:FAD/FMN-containing dehydrogenase